MAAGTPTPPIALKEVALTEVLTPEQCAHYDEHGYVVLENRIPADIMQAIRDEIARFGDIARTMTASDDQLDLEDSHTSRLVTSRKKQLGYNRLQYR